MTLQEYLEGSAKLGERIPLARLLELAYYSAFDGSITFHFRKGTPVKVEAGRPIQVELLTQAESPASINP